MKNYFKTNLLFLKQALYDDLTDRILFFTTIIFFALDYLIWQRYLSGPDIFVYLRIDLFPIKLLAIILSINTFLAISSYNKEKEVGYFLFVGNILVSVLILILEIFYLANR